MHVHILGICGTFMGSLAVLAKQLGHRVTGCDSNVYPPMSTQLEEQGIELIQGFDPAQLDPQPDCVIIGNVMSRGNPLVEAVLNRGIPYTSGPEWLSRHLLAQKWVLAVAGTHGKTTTSSMAAWILEYAGLKPGFLIGGIPKNFGVSARLGETDFFVIEADEYDTAFFDKRSKFIHYHPKTAVLNNLEFDHADIFPNLAAIQTQFHHLVRIVPEVGCLIFPADDQALAQVIAQGCWSSRCQFSMEPRKDTETSPSAQWIAVKTQADGSAFQVFDTQKVGLKGELKRGLHSELQGEVRWGLQGDHNVRNAMAALLAAHHCGVSVATCIEALCKFENVKRRMEMRGEINGISVYDDFAHHPTAIASTLEGIQQQVKLRATGVQSRVIAVIEPRSNTMKMGVHKHSLVESTLAADQVLWMLPETFDWDLDEQLQAAANSQLSFASSDEIVAHLKEQAKPGDQIVVMSNGGFDGIHEKILSVLSE